MLLIYNFGFVRTLTWFLAADRLGAASVNSESEAKDSVAYTSFIKDIPVLLNHHLNFATISEIDVG